MNMDLQKQYEKLLTAYMEEPREDHLYGAQQLSQWILEQRIPPEEVVNFHITTIKNKFPDLPEPLKISFDFLLEVMVGYGVEYRDAKNLANLQKELENEIEVAVGMQQTFLPDEPPPLSGVDIGVLSVPAKKMSGDYYNFVDHGMGLLGIAIADIIGKGIPAALCMSMIKYSMDRLDEEYLSPAEILRGLNTVVERNVNPSMFITMIYGVYDSVNHKFSYATAGHEPGLYYKASEDRFLDLETQGLVLGVSREVEYPEYQVTLEPNDALIFFTDGVTECRINGEFLDRDGLKQLIHDHLDLPAQQAVEEIYQKLFEMTGYQMQDDQTIMIIKRVGG